MTHKKHPQQQKAGVLEAVRSSPQLSKTSAQDQDRILEIVLKCASVGSIEAVLAGLETLHLPRVTLKAIHTGVGPIVKSDLDMARTGSRLVVGFEVGVQGNIQHAVHEQGVEIRLYKVIYTLIQDMKQIASSLLPAAAEEKNIGKAKVIALFKSSRKGIIVGCEVSQGALVLGRNFRIITAMGPVYTGKIDSLQVAKAAVKEARVGSQAGIKIADFNQVKLGDLVECFESVRPQANAAWKPRAGVFHF